MSVDVRVGIVSWNTADLLDRCLAALPAALGGLRAEVVVVDNDSADASAEVAARHPVVTEVVRNPTNEGYARGMNRALAGTAAPVLLALNPDTEPAPGTLAALVERLLAHPEAGLVVPRLTNPDGSLQHSAYRFPAPRIALVLGFTPGAVHRRLGRRLWLEGHHPHDRSEEVDWAIGAVHVVRAAALAGRPAPYDERWFMYVEDLELCWWVRERGWTVRLEGDVAVAHVGNAAGAQQWRGERVGRYLACTYDWYARDRGRWAARAWGVANAGASLSQIALRWRRDRATAHQLRAVLGVHLRAAAGRFENPPPPTSTGGAATRSAG